MRSEEQVKKYLEETKEAREKAKGSLLVEGKIPTIGDIATTVNMINKYDHEIEILEWVLGGILT